MLELKKIKKSYKVGETTQPVLKGIDLKLRDNEFASILGTSGSGKTTLLNIIGGLDKYDEGDLIIDGVSTKEYKDRDWDSYRNYRVGFIFQSYNLIMHQTILANVEIALTLSGVSKQERKNRAIEALTKVGLKEHINKKPNQLSGGQMQRVAIARALVNNPEIILADEPTGALDSKTSIQIMDLLKEIAQDKLVIMVTHNPELAKEYSTRIIELKDGLIINDTNPYDEKEEQESTRVINKTSMSILSALSLSFNNLLTKKGRTLLTAIAGSIGIIGIALILALSNGVNNYARSLEKTSLSDFPIRIEKTSVDLLGSTMAVFNEMNTKEECETDKLCTKDDVVKSINSESSFNIVKKNNTREIKKYFDNNKDIKKYAASIKYNYDLTLQVYSTDYIKVNPSELVPNTEVFAELAENEEYKVLAGSLPRNKNEIVIIVDSNYTINDSVLYALNIKSKDELVKNLEEARKNSNFKVKSKNIDYNDLLDKKVKLILNTDYYKEENGSYLDYSNNTEYMKDKINNGIDLTVVGVLQTESTMVATPFAYTHELIEYVISEINETSIYKEQVENKDINVLTGEVFDGIMNTYDDNVTKLGIYDLAEPSSISIYPKDYESKEKIIDVINKYNEDKKENDKITYSDMMKSLVGGITKVVSIISFVLIGFVAISLVVSSIMIAIITYISVLERTKEIGILRAIGASKKDIERVFIAETIIEGLIAGCLGVGVTYLLSAPINLVVKALGNVSNIASLSIVSALVLILLSVLLNVLAGSKPASMAAKKDPVESLRTE